MNTLSEKSTVALLKQNNKRFAPSFLEHDWYILKSLRAAIDSFLAFERLTDKAQIVVDMGCGDRPYEPLFRTGECRYIGCDISGDVDILLESGQRVNLPDNYADGVVSFQVLEHVWDLGWYLGECHRILKPGGWLLLSTHGTWLYHAHPTDYRRWTRPGLLGELRDRGFVLDRIEGIVGPLAWTTQIRLLAIRHVLETLPLLVNAILFPVVVIMNVRMMLEDWLTPHSIRNDNACVYLTLCRK
jgi:SAM-dependent methyltransferase